MEHATKNSDAIFLVLPCATVFTDSDYEVFFMYRKLIPFRLGKLCKLPAGKAFYLLLILLILPVMAQAQSLPSAFYTDLDSGPATGGQNGKGAFVTVYGSR
ncbi:MAG: hypothetical protein ACYC0Z_15920, partial [Acidobacteriaceae bacterium]